MSESGERAASARPPWPAGAAWIDGRYRPVEDAKISVRNLRRDANEQLKKLIKDKEISEDDERRAGDDVQKLTDKFVTEIDKLVVTKEAEIMTV